MIQFICVLEVVLIAPSGKTVPPTLFQQAKGSFPFNVGNNREIRDLFFFSRETANRTLQFAVTSLKFDVAGISNFSKAFSSVHFYLAKI